MTPADDARAMTDDERRAERRGALETLSWLKSKGELTLSTMLEIEINRRYPPRGIPGGAAMTPADDARAMTEAERTKLHAHMWVTFVESPATKAADGRPITVPYILARWIANLPTVHDLRIAREELDTPEMRATLTAFASASPAATTERMDLMRPDALTKAFAERGLTLASRSMAEVDLEDDGLPVGVAVNAPTPDATAALLAEADDFIAEQGDSYFARSFARFAAALRAEHEKGKELDRSNAAVVRQHGELQEEIVRLRERLADAEAFTQKYLTAIAQAIGIDSPLILIAHAESNEENYADILLKLVTASGERLAAFEALAVEAKAVVASGWRCDDWDNVVAKLAALASDDAKGAT